MVWRAMTLLIMVSFLGCSTSAETVQPTLGAPPGCAPTARAALLEGNSLFAGGDLPSAKDKYEEALEVEPQLAEAHYNLALTLQQLGEGKQARRHYLEAATLAPGNKVIWNSPPLRPHGDVVDEIEEDGPPAGIPSPGGGGLGGGLGGGGGGPGF